MKLTITSISAGKIEPGDMVSFYEPLRGWRRFLCWLRRPWKWPPRRIMRHSTIVSVSRDVAELKREDRP